MPDNRKFSLIRSITGFTVGLALLGEPAFAKDPAPKPAEAPKADAQPADTSGAEKVNVETIKEKYWARGDQSEMGVVQNRLYSKEKKISIMGFAGTSTTDPFLSVRNTGLMVGYNFSEYLAVNVLGWKSFVSASSALDTLRGPPSPKEANTNEPRYFLGSEVNGSLLYGKLSLVGKAIIYYDMHVSGGLGMMATENGKYLAPMAGLGQQVYVSRRTSIRFDYRMMMYHEDIVEKEVTQLKGQVVGTRNNWTHTISLGLNFLIGGSNQ